MAEIATRDLSLGLLGQTAESHERGQACSVVQRALSAIRAHLGMPVAYISEIVDDLSVFRAVDAPGLEAMIKPGDSRPMDEVYCRHILEGRLPELIPDTAAEPLTQTIAITNALPIGKHMSVPVRMPDGSVYGMFCCLGFEADRSLQERDLNMMRAFAELAAFEIHREQDALRQEKETQARILSTIENRQVSIVYQPIWSVQTLQPVGVECLSRFAAAPQRSPDKWFAEAASVGMSSQLERAAIQAALGMLGSLSAPLYLAVNASPSTILEDDFAALFDGLDVMRLVLELTEHADVADYNELLRALAPLRERGVQVAVDDAGAGYSSLKHILHLQPDLIKLDMSLTRSIDLDPARQALVAALVGFAEEMDSAIIAEGVETASELAMLSKLGVQKAQGYFLARPLAADQVLSLIQTKRAAA